MKFMRKIICELIMVVSYSYSSSLKNKILSSSEIS